MNTVLRHQLRKALLTQSEHDACVVTDISTFILVYQTPFFRHYQIYEVMRANGLLLFYVGFAPQQPAFILTGNPKKYSELAHADQLTITTPELAIDYVRAYLKLTCPLSHLLYTVSSVEEVKFRQQLSSEQIRDRENFTQHYATVITTPRAFPIQQGFQVTLYIVHDQTVEQCSFIVQPCGELEESIVVLEKNLPLVYGISRESYHYASADRCELADYVKQT